MCQILVDLYQSLQWSVNLIVVEVWSLDQLQGTGGAREVGGSGGDDLWWGFPLFQWCRRPEMEEEGAADCRTGCRGCWEWKCPWAINKPIKVNTGCWLLYSCLQIIFIANEKETKCLFHHLPWIRGTGDQPQRLAHPTSMETTLNVTPLREKHWNMTVEKCGPHRTVIKNIRSELY